MIQFSEPYRFESDMLAAIEDCRDIFQVSREACRSNVLREMAVGRVIPDVLFASWKEPTLRSAHRLTALECHILALVETGNQVDDTAICTGLRLHHERAATAFNSLTRKGILIRRGECYSLAKGWGTRDLSLVAIEAKLSRWRTALAQAQNYLSFANSSWVVLDRNQPSSSSVALHDFASAGVGLAFLSGRTIQVMVPPKQHQCVSPSRWIAAAKLYRSTASAG